MYKLPDTLSEDITKLGSLAKAYQKKEIETVQFKAFRVPMGIYEQRKDEVYMVRIRTTGGVVYPEQLLQILSIAQNHASDLLHITTRQEIQIQNLSLDEVEPILNELQQIGLSSKGGGGNTVRNILVSADSGISHGEVFDTTPYAMALTTKLIAESDSYLLPRKMKIAFSSDDQQIDYAAVNDLGLVAKIQDGQRGFKVYAGGGGGSKPTVGWTLFDFIPESELFVVAEAMKKMFSEHGNRKNKHKARIRYIFYRLGEEEALRLIREYYEEAKKTTPPFVLKNQPDETAEAKTAFTVRDITPGQGYEIWRKRYTLDQRQAGYSSVTVPFPLGNIPLTNTTWVENVRNLLYFISLFGKDTIRFTTTQNIRLRNIPTEALPELYAILQDIVPEIGAPLPANHIVSCTGADTCRLGITLSRGLATAIRRVLLRADLPESDKLAHARIHISGCPNSCGQQLWADIGFSGKALHNDRVYPGYQVHLAANRSDNPRLGETIGSINARDIPSFVVRLLTSYLKAQPAYPALTAYLENEGRSRAIELLSEYEEIPSFADDKNYYFDWGAESIFSIVNRGTPECSAGLFDMIELDLNYIRTHRQSIETETETDAINHLLYEIVYSASRMLLVTRGAEPKTVADTFDLFLRHFIESGLVEERYRALVESARDRQSYDFLPYKADVYSLSDAVIELYQHMDDSLQFKNVNTVPQPAQSSAETTEKQEPVAVRRVFKDLRGVACPMNFVHAKIQLATMNPGEELEILLDDGAPIANVPGSVRNEGHRILEQTPVDDYWKVVIKKKYEQD
ncbi:MAG: sulfurtransferase TusA family protein [Tannerella sp.]|jgi:sulfite reductase (ferredoxin)|nr:sulfurtransferase TusA family protein [Tannerella sp.]